MALTQSIETIDPMTKYNIFHFSFMNSSSLKIYKVNYGSVDLVKGVHAKNATLRLAANFCAPQRTRLPDK